jgi:hypothetical protein
VTVYEFGLPLIPAVCQEFVNCHRSLWRAARRFRTFSGIEQTDKVFDHDIVERIGRTFYRKVLAPAIRKAFQSGKTYRQIRDEIRKQW